MTNGMYKKKQLDKWSILFKTTPILFTNKKPAHPKKKPSFRKAIVKKPST